MPGVLLAALLVGGCAEDGPSAAVPSPVPERPRTICPQPASEAVPGDLPFADRQLLNLGGGTFGHRLVYQRTLARRLVLSVGEDPLDALEDLDMDASAVQRGGLDVTVSTTLQQPGLTVVEVGDAAGPLPAGCGELYVLAERLTEGELDAVLQDLVLVPPAES